MTPTFNIPPPADFAEFARLPSEERSRIQDVLTALRVMHEAANKADAARGLAKLAAGERGFSCSSMLRLHRRYMAAGDWHVLVRCYFSPLLSKRCVGDNQF